MSNIQKIDTNTYINIKKLFTQLFECKYPVNYEYVHSEHWRRIPIDLIDQIIAEYTELIMKDWAVDKNIINKTIDDLVQKGYSYTDITVRFGIDLDVNIDNYEDRANKHPMRYRIDVHIDTIHTCVYQSTFSERHSIPLMSREYSKSLNAKGKEIVEKLKAIYVLNQT